ncbi:hypothetical protein LCGC14_1076490 [marine sediment metagenome]|uniref:Uncharacterized protein n=1 Tax=marine sediment metagenome TaxID=412755 RepID=A0A0F9MLE1_9ZZZZ
MPNENIYDEVLGDVKNIMLEIRDGIRKQYKNVKPFATKPISTEEQIYDYNTRGQEIFNQIADKEGPQTAVKWQQDMEKIVERRQNVKR